MSFVRGQSSWVLSRGSSSSADLNSDPYMRFVPGECVSKAAMKSKSNRSMIAELCCAASFERVK